LEKGKERGGGVKILLQTSREKTKNYPFQKGGKKDGLFLFSPLSGNETQHAPSIFLLLSKKKWWLFEREEKRATFAIIFK